MSEQHSDYSLHEDLHNIHVKLGFGVLHRPEDSYLWESCVQRAVEQGYSIENWRRNVMPR